MADPTWDQTTPAAPALTQSVTASGATPTWDNTQDAEDKYGTPGQMALTAVEHGAKGFAGPIATGAEKLASMAGVPGLTPADQAGREETNPWTAGMSEAGGLGVGILTGTGEAKLMTAAGEGAAKLAGLATPASKLARIGAGALKGAVETALYQGGDEISKRINDPNLAMSSAISHIGLSGLIGAAGGGLLGTISPLWSAANDGPVARSIQDFNNATDGSVIDQAANQPVQQIEEAGLGSGLRKQKSNAAELADIDQRNDWGTAPGITSDSREIQMGTDALLKGPPSIASIQARREYQNIYDKIGTSVDQATNAPAETLTETQAGNSLKDSLSAKLEAEYAPVKQMYQDIEPYQQAIPLSDRSTGTLSRTIGNLIEEKGLVPGTDRYNLVRTFADGIGDIDNLQKLKNFRTEVWKSAGQEKDIAGAISEKLNGVESRAIRRYAETMKSPMAKEKILSVVDQLEDANGQYSKFRGKLAELGDALGKKNIRGPQDFLDFVADMNPQKLAGKLFSQNNTEFASYFAKNFPEEFETMRGYQRGLIRQAATKEGALVPKLAAKQVFAMEPEMQKLLYSPGELQTLQDAQTYLEAMPKSFNPSGTDHMSAMRGFFEHPTGAVLANLRDFGIQSFIKAFGRATPGAENEAARILPLMGDAVGKKDVNPGAFKHATDYAMSVIRGENSTARAVKSVFNASIPVAASEWPSKDDTERLDNKLKEYRTNTDKYAQVGGELGHYLGGHDIALKGLAYNAVNYLNGLRPVVAKAAPLDPDLEPSREQTANFNRALAIAEKPLSILSLVKEGTITSQDVAHLNALYPGTLQNISQKLMDSLSDHVGKGNAVPYKIRFGLSALLGQPMDSGMTPQAVASNQAVFAQSNAREQAKGAPMKSKPSMVGMREMKPGNRISLSPQDDDA